MGGLLVGKLVFARNTKKQVEDAEAQAASILKEAELRAETIKKEKQLEAKERFVQLKADHDREILERNKKIGEAENRIKQNELNINQKVAALDKQIKDNDVIKEKSMLGKKYMGIERSTFLINKIGKINKIWRGVKVNGHVEEVLEAIKQI